MHRQDSRRRTAAAGSWLADCFHISGTPLRIAPHPLKTAAGAGPLGRSGRPGPSNPTRQTALDLRGSPSPQASRRPGHEGHPAGRCDAGGDPSRAARRRACGRGGVRGAPAGGCGASGAVKARSPGPAGPEMAVRPDDSIAAYLSLQALDAFAGTPVRDPNAAAAHLPPGAVAVLVREHGAAVRPLPDGEREILIAVQVPRPVEIRAPVSVPKISSAGSEGDEMIRLAGPSGSGRGRIRVRDIAYYGCEMGLSRRIRRAARTLPGPGVTPDSTMHVRQATRRGCSGDAGRQLGEWRPPAPSQTVPPHAGKGRCRPGRRWVREAW